MADYVITDINYVLPLAKNFTFDEGASFLVNPLTAVGMVERVKDLNSKTCIVTAAYSQIGRMIVSLLILNKIVPICTVRREE